MRLKAIKFAFAKQPPQPESLAAIKGNLHRLLTNKTNVNTHPERVAKLWTTWLALQSAMPRQASPGPVQGLVVKDPVERSLLLLADLLVNNELYGKTRGDQERQFQFIWKLIDVDLHKSLSAKRAALQTRRFVPLLPPRSRVMGWRNSTSLVSFLPRFMLSLPR